MSARTVTIDVDLLNRLLGFADDYAGCLENFPDIDGPFVDRAKMIESVDRAVDQGRMAARQGL